MGVKAVPVALKIGEVTQVCHQAIGGMNQALDCEDQSCGRFKGDTSTARRASSGWRATGEPTFGDLGRDLAQRTFPATLGHHFHQGLQTLEGRRRADSPQGGQRRPDIFTLGFDAQGKALFILEVLYSYPNRFG